MKSLKKYTPGKSFEEKRTAWTRDPELLKFYNSKEWRDLRKAVLAAEPFCKECRMYGKHTPATVVDHIKPISQGGAKFDYDNLQSLCKWCHNSKSSREKNQKC